MYCFDNPKADRVVVKPSTEMLNPNAFYFLSTSYIFGKSPLKTLNKENVH